MNEGLNSITTVSLPPVSGENRPAGTLLTHPAIAKRDLDVVIPGHLKSLTETAQTALKDCRISSSAAKFAKRNGMDSEQAINFAISNLPKEVVAHLNRMPDQLELVVVAAEPASKAEWLSQVKAYEKDRSKYLVWVAGKALEQGSAFQVEARVPVRNLSTSKLESTTMSLGKEELEIMQRGITPLGWSVEHVDCRALKKGTEDKNSVGNLQIMPKAINDWTGTLERFQFEKALPGRWESPRQFMICARPKAGPAQGYLFYGAKNPQTTDPEVIAKWHNQDISTLPLTGGIVRNREFVRTNGPFQA